MKKNKQTKPRAQTRRKPEPKPVVLPKVMSQLIRIALTDLRKVERSDKYHVNMSYAYHCPTRNGSKCLVCAAGAVMAKTLGAARGVSLIPAHFGRNEAALSAIDNLRAGWVIGAASHLGVEKLPDTYKGEDVPVTPYGEDRKAFHRDMLKLARDLEREGL